jgi:hypothetical protein
MQFLFVDSLTYTRSSFQLCMSDDPKFRLRNLVVPVRIRFCKGQFQALRSSCFRPFMMLMNDCGIVRFDECWVLIEILYRGDGGGVGLRVEVGGGDKNGGRWEDEVGREWE